RAYASYLAPIAVFLLPGVVGAVMGRTRWILLPIALYLAWPAMHGAMKRYQYGHVAYGDRHTAADLPLRSFFGIYMRGLLLAIAAIAVLFGFAAALHGLSGLSREDATGVLGLVVGIV